VLAATPADGAVPANTAGNQLPADATTGWRSTTWRRLDNRLVDLRQATLRSVVSLGVVS